MAEFMHATPSYSTAQMSSIAYEINKQNNYYAIKFSFRVVVAVTAAMTD